VSKTRLVRLAAPAAFLLAATIAVLLVRAGLRADDDEQREPATVARATRAQPTTSEGRPPRPPEPRTYTVQEGDTLDQIALDFDTTVERLLELNPDIEPTELRPGQRLRVP
jgi:Tfp pilus assembly protein FimV